MLDLQNPDFSCRMHWNSLKRLPFGLFFILSIAGCGLTPQHISVGPPPVYVSVDAYASPNARLCKKFILLSGRKGVEATDLQFQEFADVTSKVLVQEGFLASHHADDADIGVFLVYSVGEPRPDSVSYQLPQFGQTGVASSTTYGTVNPTGSGGATYSGTTVNTPAYGITGYTTITQNYTTFSRIVILRAVDLKKSQLQGKNVILWEVHVNSIGPNDDLRKVFPYLIVAAGPFIGSSTGSIVQIIMPNDDARVIALRGSKPPVGSSAP